MTESMRQTVARTSPPSGPHIGDDESRCAALARRDYTGLEQGEANRSPRTRTGRRGCCSA